jgi:hypothetical protein
MGSRHRLTYRQIISCYTRIVEEKKVQRLAPFWRIVIEVGFIVFLFYSNLLMGEFTQSGLGESRGLWWAIQNIFTVTNFLIAIISGLVGYVVFESLRSKL